MSGSENSHSDSNRNLPRLTRLTVEQVEQIDRLLASIGEYGELRLIVQRGVLKYINKVESHKAWRDEEDE